MNVHISYKLHKTPDIEKNISQLVEKLRKRLQVFRPELVHLKGTVQQNSPREGTTVSLNLRLPSGQIAAQESAMRPAAAIKSAFDELLQQVGKHKDLLRSHKGRRSRNGANGAGIPFEETLAVVRPRAVSADDVRAYVNAKLGRLQRFVEREIFFREAAEEIPPGSLAPDEVVDEVVARALVEGPGKPEHLSLEPWLYRLALRCIADLSVRGEEYSSGVPLEESVRKQNVRASDEAELQFHQPDETFTEETVIPDRRVATPEEIAASDEVLALVHVALAGAGSEDREVFILHTLEGFSVEEVSAITERSGDEVRASIAAARERLRNSPPLSGGFRDKLLQRVARA